MESIVAGRKREWWENYPLHQVWCNNHLPLMPRFEYRPGDQWNANNLSLHWLFLRVWTMEAFSFEVSVTVSPDTIAIGLILPYLRVTLGLWNAHTRFGWWLYRKLRRAAPMDRGQA